MERGDLKRRFLALSQAFLGAFSGKWSVKGGQWFYWFYWERDLWASLSVYDILLRNVRDLYPHYVEDNGEDRQSRMASLLGHVVRMSPEQVRYVIVGKFIYAKKAMKAILSHSMVLNPILLQRHRRLGHASCTDHGYNRSDRGLVDTSRCWSDTLYVDIDVKLLFVDITYYLCVGLLFCHVFYTCILSCILHMYFVMYFTHVFCHVFYKCILSCILHYIS